MHWILCFLFSHTDAMTGEEGKDTFICWVSLSVVSCRRTKSPSPKRIARRVYKQHVFSLRGPKPESTLYPKKRTSWSPSLRVASQTPPARSWIKLLLLLLLS